MASTAIARHLQQSFMLCCRHKCADCEHDANFVFASRKGAKQCYLWNLNPVLCHAVRYKNRETLTLTHTNPTQPSVDGRQQRRQINLSTIRQGRVFDRIMARAAKMVSLRSPFAPINPATEISGLSAKARREPETLRDKWLRA